MLTLHSQVMITRALIHSGDSFRKNDPVRIEKFIAIMALRVRLDIPQK